MVELVGGVGGVGGRGRFVFSISINLVSDTICHIIHLLRIAFHCFLFTQSSLECLTVLAALQHNQTRSKMNSHLNYQLIKESDYSARSQLVCL